MSLILFFFLFVTQTIYAESNTSAATLLDREQLSLSQAEKHPDLVTLYRPNYILPFYRTFSPYQSIYAFQTPNNQPVMHDELKAQLSLLVPLYNQRLQGYALSLNAAYTQLMYWQVYAKSQYFRETNYEPELFVEAVINANTALQLGVNHQSNGRGGSLERSWNRTYLQASFSGANWRITTRLWMLMAKGESSDIHNPDIEHFLGHDNVVLAYNFNHLTVSLELQNIKSGYRRGFIKAGASYPLLKHISAYVQYFDGYGQSLIEYNHRTKSVGVGLVWNDFAV